MVRAIWGSENEKWLLDGGGDIDSGDFNKKKEDDGISRCCFSPAGKKDQLQICRDFYLAFIQSILRAKNNWTLVESLIFALAQCGKEHLCELPQKREKSQYYCVDILVRLRNIELQFNKIGAIHCQSRDQATARMAGRWELVTSEIMWNK